MSENNFNTVALTEHILDLHCKENVAKWCAIHLIKGNSSARCIFRQFQDDWLGLEVECDEETSLFLGVRIIALTSL